MSMHDHQDRLAPLGQLPLERQRAIVQLVGEAGRVRASELASRFACSIDTVRRDLELLAAEGQVQRVHGGAVARQGPALPFRTRVLEVSDEKQRIGRAAARLVEPGSVVVLDGGTTCLELARHLPGDLPATVITPSPAAAQELATRGALRVELVGGRLPAQTMASVGPQAVEAFGRLRPDLCFLGPCAVHVTAGLTCSDIDEQAVKVAMVDGAVEVVALATQDKLGAVFPFLVAGTERLDRLVCDAAAPADRLEPMLAAGLDVVRAT